MIRRLALVAMLVSVAMGGCLTEPGNVRWSNRIVDGEGVFSPGETMRFEVTNDVSGPGQFSWDFGDGNVATGRTVEHTWSSPGSYLVTVESWMGSSMARIGVANETEISGFAPLSGGHASGTVNNSSSRTLELDERNERTAAKLEFDRGGPTNRYEGRLVAPNGSVVKAACCPTSELTVTVERPLPPGEYVLEVGTREGAPSDYAGQIEILYENPP